MWKIRKTLIAVAVLALLIPAAPLRGAPAAGGRLLVCLDPGHGGTDSGAQANGLFEKDINLDVALRARPMVEQMGYRVMMTREKDIYLSLEERCKIANRAGATIFVSVHNNAHTSDSQGTETYCYYDSEEGRRLATCIQQELVKRLKRPDRGVKEAGFYVLKNTDMTAALLEGAFLTNTQEAKLLKDPNFRQKMAEGVAAGINDYLLDPGRFDEYILIMNPDPESEAQVELECMKGNGKTQTLEREIPPESRLTVHLDEYVFNSDVSVLVEGTNKVPVVAERAMYFDFEMGRGGHDAPGVPSANRQWYFAEGSTAWGFSTFLLVQNPSEEDNTVRMEFQRSDGSIKRFNCSIGPHSRFTLNASSVPGLEAADFSTGISSEKPVVAERAMYFDRLGNRGGHDSPGITARSRRWYMAEGFTGAGFDTYVLLGNPNSVAALATVEFMLPKGNNVVRQYRLPPSSRTTVHLNGIQGLSGTDVSTMVSSDQPILAERSVYFDYKGIKEGTNSIATPATSKQWYLAEGYTGEGFDSYILVMNPGDTPTLAHMTFMLPDGSMRGLKIVVPARTRQSVHVNGAGGMGNTEFSTRVYCSQPVVVERAMYFKYGSRVGGHNAMGVRAPALLWYFAEGCTG